MKNKKFKIAFIQSIFFMTLGFFLGIGAIWPGLITESGRKCFLQVIQDGSDGNVSLNTIFSITPNYLIKIKNAKNNYFKILFIGDFCFRKI